MQDENTAAPGRRGAKRYHGKPCRNCGDTLKYVSCAGCIRCNRERNIAYVKANPERVRGHMRKSWLKRWYGITPEDYERMLAAQDGKCAICLTDDPKPWKVFAVDHDHDTGSPRGLLCERCNTGIARFDEDLERMARAIAYLRDAA